MDKLLESFIAFPDSDSTSIEASFDRILASKCTDSDQNDFIQRTLQLSSVLLEAAKKSVRKRKSAHNALVWPLPLDLTVRATCSFFRKCTMDRRCFVNIDLVTSVPKVNDAVVSKMIHRAGHELRSVKLGVLPNSRTHASRSRKRNVLTRSCLSSLKENNGALGSQLRRLHLYYIEAMDDTTILALSSVCPSLIDIKLVCLHIGLKNTMESLSIYCHLLEHLTFEIFHSDSSNLHRPTFHEFVLNCPNITNLALKGFSMFDDYADILVKGFRMLKYIDLSKTGLLTGSFLKNLGSNDGVNRLEVMILLDCVDLKQVEVELFTTTLLAGDLRLLRHLDISNKNGLETNGNWYRRCVDSSFIPIEKLLEQRPSFCLVAEFRDKIR